MKGLLSHGHLSLLFLISIFYCGCFAQENRSVDLVREGLYQPIYKLCREQAVDFPIRWGYQGVNSPNPITTYYQVSGNKEDNTCRRDLIDIKHDNNTLQLVGNGITVVSKANVDNHWTYNVKFTGTGSPTISWKEIESYPPNDCGYTTKETIYSGSYRTIYSISIPAAPTLTTAKAIVLFPESNTIVSTVCPNTLEAETDYAYTRYGPAYEEWAFSCGSDGQPDFTNSRTFYYNNTIVYNTGLGQLKPGTVIRARCNDNGCIGEASQPTAVSVQYVTPNCPDTETNFIDNIVRSSRRDYHHYMLETKVCQTGVDNPNCTKEKVFALMKSNKTLMGPIASDIPETIPAVFPGGGWDLGNWETRVPLMGSNLVYKLDASPVQNCETVSLPSAVGMAANLAALSQGIGPSTLVHNITPQFTLTSNPIVQYIDEQSYTITNYTKQGHVFHPGKIVRIVVEECNQIKIVTIGVGQHSLGDNYFGEYMSGFNARSGKLLFNNIDQRLIYEFSKLPR